MTRKTLLAAFALVALACGKRGDPRPPIPVIPQATSDLVVTQRADQVILAWTYPSLTTAGRSLPSIERIQILRHVEELPVSAVGRDPNAILPGDTDPTLPRPMAEFARVPTLTQAQFTKLSHRIDSIEKANLAGATIGDRLVYADRAPFQAADGRPVRVTYAVVTEGDSARSEISNLAIIVPLAVATPPGGLTATADAGGVTLSWEAPKTSVHGTEAPIVTGYHVYRTAPGQPLEAFATPINNAPVKSPTYTDVPAYGEHEYRVTAVATEGPPLVQSSLSVPVVATFRDLVPPSPTASVTALVEPNAIRLIWDPVDAPDLAGYRIYRMEGLGHENPTDGKTILLVPDPIAETTWLNKPVSLGLAFRYAVAAVDRSGNESGKTWSQWIVAPKTP